MGRIILIPAFLAVWLLCMIGPATAQQTVKTGPEVGERIPAFALPDQHGKIRDLASISGPKGALVVFLRSADW